MSTAATAESDLTKAYEGVSANYRGVGADPTELYRQLRETTPVVKDDVIGKLGVPTIAGHDPNRPVFTLFKYKDIMAVLRDAENFTSGFIAEGLGSFFDGLILTGMDGEAHRSARNLLGPVFTPQVVNRWRETVIDPVIRDEFVAKIAPNKKGELIADMGLLFPIRAIYALLGFPSDKPEDIERYAAWALAILAGPQVDPEKAKAARVAALDAAKQLYDAIRPLVAQRRAEGTTGDDLIRRLLHAEFEGRRLDDHEITTFVRSLLPAAAETTTRSFGSMMTLLLERPEVLERVRADRSLVNRVIDESVRFEPVATFKVRQAAKDLQIQGVDIPKGAMVNCIVASANRDEEAYDKADTFDIDRKLKPSFGFGFGPHMCIGQFVAKVELQCALNAILDLLPNIRFDPSQPKPVIAGVQLRGPSTVHVIWD